MADSVVDVNSGSSSLRDLVQQKEKEWKEAQELRIKSLETALAEKEKQLHSERIRFRKLKEDFVYNLKLVEERDAELERYDSLFSELKNIDSVRTAEVSELKIKLDDLKSKLEQEEKAQEDLKKHYQQVNIFQSLGALFSNKPPLPLTSPPIPLALAPPSSSSPPCLL